jgi:hypothetical protein
MKHDIFTGLYRFFEQPCSWIVLLQDEGKTYFIWQNLQTWEYHKVLLPSEPHLQRGIMFVLGKSFKVLPPGYLDKFEDSEDKKNVRQT